MKNKVFKTKLNNQNFLKDQRFILLLGVIVVIIALIIVDRTFFSYVNTMGFLDQIAIYGILAVGMTLLLISGSFDISIGSVYALCGVLAVFLQPYGLFISITVSIISAMVVGFLNGILVVKAKISPFIVTLSTMFLVKGLALFITDSFPVSSESEFFNNISQNSFLQIRFTVFYFILIFLLSILILNYTKFGAYTYAIGSNEEAAKFAGINTDLYRTLYFIFCSVCAGIAGILFSSKVSSGSAVFGDEVVIIIIATVILGGTSLFGGKGSLSGTLLGLILMGLLIRALIVFDIPLYWQEIFRGSVILTVVIIDALRFRRSKIL